MEKISFEDFKNKYIGENGTISRGEYEKSLAAGILGNNLSKLRRIKKIKLEQLAKRAKVKAKEVYMIETGKKNVSATTIKKVCNALCPTIKIDDYIDSTIGLKGTPERDKFDAQLKKEVEAFYNKKSKAKKPTDTSSANHTKSYGRHQLRP